MAAVGDTFAVQTDAPGPQGVTPGLTDWMAGTGNEPLFGDGLPGDPTGGQGPVAAVGDTFAVQTDTPGPQGVTPGLTDWMAGTGNEPLFGDGSPGDPTGGQGPPNATDTPTDTQSLINVIQPTPLDVHVVDPATGSPSTPPEAPGRLLFG